MFDREKFLDFMNNSHDFNGHNNLRFTEIGDGYAVVEADLGPESLNPQGCAHGSLIFLLCDEATGVAAACDGRYMLTLSSNVNFLRAGTGKYLRCVGERVKEGRTTGVYSAKVYDDRERLVATAEFSIYFTGGEIDLDKGEGRF